MASIPLRVLGVDPGLTRCGIGIVDVAADRSATLVHVGVVRSSPGDPIEVRLTAIAAGIREVLDAYSPAVVAVERVFSQQNRNTVMGTAQASGIALLLAGERGLRELSMGTSQDYAVAAQEGATIVRLGSVLYD